MKEVGATPLTPEHIADAIEKYDRIIRPKALIISPRMEKELLNAHPEIEHKVFVFATNLCSDETAYLIDRSKLEEFVPIPMPPDEGFAITGGKTWKQ